MYAGFQSHLDLAKRYWKEIVLPGSIVIDATVGNGQDTLFLARLLQGKGRLIGYDIQPDALLTAKKNLESLSDEEQKGIELRLESHKNFFEKEATLIVYNLGYLPGGDKALTTLRESTLESIKRALKIVQPLGGISITCYPGHAEGACEESDLLKYLRTLSPKEWSICYHQWINRIKPPSLIWIRKRESPPS